MIQRLLGLLRSVASEPTPSGPPVNVLVLGTPEFVSFVSRTLKPENGFSVQSFPAFADSVGNLQTDPEVVVLEQNDMREGSQIAAINKAHDRNLPVIAVTRTASIH